MKILMVCLGNICRSPLAEGIFKQKLRTFSPNLVVDSCGTASYHVGSQPDVRSIATAKKHGIDISQQKARKFHLTDFDVFDYIFAMDKQNLSDLQVLAPNVEALNKLRLALPNSENVPDPYYGKDRDFELVYQLLDKASDDFLNELKSN